MEPIDQHLLAQTVLYFLLFACGFIISIPLGVSQIQFDNSCLLYARFKDGILQKVSSSNNCNFPLYMSVVGCILYGLAIGSYYVYSLLPSRRSQTTGANMWVLPFVCTNAVMAMTSFIAACMISVGFKKFCNGLLENHAFYTHCADAEGSDWHNVQTGKHFHPGHYYRMMNISQIACWIAFLLWVAQLALGFLRFFKNRKLQPQGTKSAPPAISSIS